LTPSWLGLFGDPCRAFNYSLSGFASVVRSVVHDWRLPTILFGGGGYNHPNVARCNAHLTSVAIGQELDLSGVVPDHTSKVDEFAPDYGLDIEAGLMRDENDGVYLEEVENDFRRYVGELKAKYGSRA
jgi:histone deacetylase 8